MVNPLVAPCEANQCMVDRGHICPQSNTAEHGYILNANQGNSQTTVHAFLCNMSTPRQLTFFSIDSDHRPVVRISTDNCLYAVDFADFLSRTTRTTSNKVTLHVLE